MPLTLLSGGEKRYVEMVKVMFSRADVICMDEPTNHMDYFGKKRFIDWLRSTPALSRKITEVNQPLLSQMKKNGKPSFWATGDRS